MKKRIVSVVLAVGILAVLAGAQDTTKKNAPPKPAVGPSQALLDNWNDVGRKLIAMAEDFPEDKYDFKPVPAQRSFAEQLLHAANANYFFTNPVMGLKPPAGEDPKRDQYKTKAAVVGFVKGAFADGAAAIKQKGDKGMNDLIVDPFANQQTRVSDMAWGLLEHSGRTLRTTGRVLPHCRIGAARIAAKEVVSALIPYSSCARCSTSAT